MYRSNKVIVRNDKVIIRKIITRKIRRNNKILINKKVIKVKCDKNNKINKLFAIIFYNYIHISFVL